MSTLSDYKKFAILYVDDEEKSLKSFSRAFGDQFWIFTALNAVDGLRLLEEHKDEIGLLMTDQRMPGEKGVWLLEHARKLRPQIIRILSTGYADMDAVVAAVNTGAIYKFVTKPWDPTQLEITLKRGLEFFMVQQERNQLLQEKTDALQKMMVADRVVSLGLLAAGLSHHIRNALVAVKTFLDLTPYKLQEEKLDLDNLKNPDFWKEYHLSVQGQIEKINDLLKDLWLASEKPPFNFADRVRLDEVIHKVMSQMKATLAVAKLTVTNEVSDTVPPLLVDQAKFVRLFELILKDEVANLPPGSEVKFTAQISPESTEDRREVLIEIENNGPALPDEALRVMFDPFVVRNDSPQEYGINLMASYFIVHHHGGSIAARRAASGGTIFTIRIPTNPNRPPLPGQNPELLQRVMVNDAVWKKMIETD